MPSVKPKPPFTRSSFASRDTSASSAGSRRTMVGFSPCACAQAAQTIAESTMTEEISACLIGPPNLPERARRAQYAPEEESADETPIVPAGAGSRGLGRLGADPFGSGVPEQGDQGRRPVLARR